MTESEEVETWSAQAPEPCFEGEEEGGVAGRMRVMVSCHQGEWISTLMERESVGREPLEMEGEKQALHLVWSRKWVSFRQRWERTEGGVCFEPMEESSCMGLRP